MNSDKTRCTWANDHPLYIDYHDNEWGVPVYDERLLFEFLILEGMQAGLSWLTILKKRDNYRACFNNFDPNLIAKYDHHNVEELLKNTGIIRNKLKIEAIITNARAFLQLKEKQGDFSAYIWEFVDGQPIKNHWQTGKQIPAKTPISGKLSMDLKKRGFKFVGSTICYAFMQAVGMVNDHTTDCFRYRDLKLVGTYKKQNR